MNTTEKMLHRAMIAAEIAFKRCVDEGTLIPGDYLPGCLAWDLREHVASLGIPLETTHDDVREDLAKTRANRQAREAYAAKKAKRA